MKAYVDTSVLLRIVLGEAGGLRQWRSITVAISSELIRVEALRVLDRARIRLRFDDEELARRRAEVLSTLEGFHIAPLARAVLDRAAEPFPTLLGTLDAIHLATAVLVRETLHDVVVATHDVELARAARSLGFRVVGSTARASGVRGRSSTSSR